MKKKSKQTPPNLNVGDFKGKGVAYRKNNLSGFNATNRQKSTRND